MSYADKRAIVYTVLAGSSEMEKNTYTLKNMKSGEQETLTLEDLKAKCS